jgi:hypothetical protein
MASTLAVTAGVCGIVSGVHAHDRNDQLAVVEQVQTRNAFWESINDGGLRGEDPVAELSRSLSALSGPGAQIERGVLNPSDVRDVFVAPGVLEGVNEAFGEEVLAGITRSGDRGDRMTTESMACEDCGYLSDTFVADAERAASGDVSALLDPVPPVQEPLGANYLLVVGPSAWGLGTILALLVGWAASRGSHWDRRDGLGVLDVRRAGRVSKVLAGLALPLVVVPWALHADAKDARARRAAQRAERERLAQVRADVLAQPAGSELLRAQENLAKLETLTETEEVKRAKDATRELISELGGTADALDAIATKRVVAQVLEENEALRIRNAAAVASVEEVYRG